MNDQQAKKYRWAGQVEKTANKLNTLLADPPDTIPRQPEINPKLIERLMAVSGQKPPKTPAPMKITFTNQEKNQRDWMREIALDARWDQEKTVQEYARLDAAGKTPRKNRTQDSTSYARALWNDGLQKGWLRDLQHPALQEDVDEILVYLETNQVKATYNAVAAAVAIHHTQLVKLFPLLGKRRHRASWVVNKDSLQPTGYTSKDIHPNFDRAKTVITDGIALRKALGW
jgi:hypothetical protein